LINDSGNPLLRANSAFEIPASASDDFNLAADTAAIGDAADTDAAPPREPDFCPWRDFFLRTIMVGKTS